MPVNVQRGIMRVLGIVEHHVTVVGVSDRAPWLRRVRFFGASLVDAFEGLPGEWIRLWVPDASQEGLLRQRAYTVVAFSREGGWFDLDMVLHEPDGPASAWARAVRPGAEAVASLSRYGSAHVGEEGPLTLLGDLSSLPAIEAICADAAAQKAAGRAGRRLRVFLDAQGHAVEGVLSVPGAEVTLTEDPVGALEGVESPGHVWAGLGRARITDLRGALKRATHPRGASYARAYWIEGKPFG